jgi:hypothetical protein
MQAKINLIYDNIPDFTAKEIIYHLSPVGQIKRAPDGTNPQTVEDFLKVCKTYHEININTKTRRMSGYVHHFYRCLFSDPKQAAKAYDKISKQWEDYKKEKARQEFEKSRKKEELFKAMEISNEE